MWGFSWTEVLTSTMVLFAVIDIIGSIPIVIDLRQKTGQIQAGKATLVAMVIMILFLFIGERILEIINIDIGSFAIAGSFILFLMSLEMILGIKLFKGETPQSTSIVPLAFPVIAGAGTMTSLLSLRAEFEAINIVISILINMIMVYIALRLSERLEKLLGQVGVAILRKAFGIILLAIAVKLFKSNVGI